MADPQLLRDVLAEHALLVTPEEAAALLRVGRTTVYALMKAGDLHPEHIGRSCRLSRAELARYIDDLTSSTPRPPDRSALPSTNKNEVHGSVHSLPDVR
jgi:excisionase family DNA binding protein